MFQQAVIRLTVIYLILVMILSAVFSVALYGVSTQELNRLVARQQAQQALLDQAFLSPADRQAVDDFFAQRTEETEKSEHAIALRLIYLNALILLLGGAASYLLARRTLHPIEETLEAQKRFTSDASHELRTPLTAIKSEIEVALRDRGMRLPEARKLLKSNLEEVAKLEVLSNGLLKLARQDQKLDYVETMPVEELIDAAINRIQRAATAKHMRIVRKVSAEKESVQGERWGLVESLFILLDNAVKYSPSRTTITVSADIVHKHLVMAVTDEGQGIAPHDLPHIFRRFYRADQSRSKETIAGYGLGLSIADRIIRLHGGDIRVASTPNQGSVFTVTLPLVQPEPKRRSRT